MNKEKWSILLVWAGGGKVLGTSNPDCGLQMLRVMGLYYALSGNWLNVSLL